MHVINPVTSSNLGMVQINPMFIISKQKKPKRKRPPDGSLLDHGTGSIMRRMEKTWVNWGWATLWYTTLHGYWVGISPWFLGLLISLNHDVGDPKTMWDGAARLKGCDLSQDVANGSIVSGIDV